MPPQRRRRIAVGAGGSIGTLLADTRQAIADAERAAAKAEADAKKSAGQRLKQAQQVASNYIKDGSLTYEEAKAQLDLMLKEEADPEAKMYISDYITDLKTTRDTRDINNLSEDYTYGRISYDQFRERATAKMSGVSNEIIKQAIAKNMDAARVTENQRLVSKWSSDYSSGRLPYAEYTQRLQGLKSDPSQKSPAEMDKIQATIDAAQLNEQSLEDNKAYLAYQANPSSAATALAYFNKRLAESKNPQDANRVEQYIKSIQSAQAARGNSSATAANTAINTATKAEAERYEKEVFQPALKAAERDPIATIRAYDAKAEFYAFLRDQGGSLSTTYQTVIATTPQAAMTAAGAAEYNRVKAEIAGIKETIAKHQGAKDAVVDRGFLAGKLKDIARLAAKLETSEWPVAPGMRSEAVGWRKESADQIELLAQDALKEYVDAKEQVGVEINSRYDEMVRDGNTKDNTMLKGSGVLLDGSAEDRSRFAAWVQGAPAETLAKVFNMTRQPKGTVVGGIVVDKEDLDVEQTKSVMDLLKIMNGANRAQQEATKYFLEAQTGRDPGRGPRADAQRLADEADRMADARDRQAGDISTYQPSWPINERTDLSGEGQSPFNPDPETARENRNAMRGSMGGPVTDTSPLGVLGRPFQRDVMDPVGRLAQGGQDWYAQDAARRQAEMGQTQRDFGSAGYMRPQPSVAEMAPTSWAAPTIDAGAPSFITQLPASFTPPPLADPTIPQFSPLAEVPGNEAAPIDTASETKREDARLTR